MTLDELARALRRHPGVSEFVIREVVEQRHYLQRRGPSQHLGEQTESRLSARIFVDTRQGRGEAAMRLGSDALPRHLLDAAVGRAALNVGPAWTLPAPTAPARVAVADAAVATDPTRALELVADTLAGAREATAWAAVADVRCVTSAGFDNRYRETRIGTRARAPHGGATASEARRVADLRPHALGAGQPAARTEQGEYALVLAASAHSGDPRQSIFAPFLALADADSYRLGRSRIREGGSIEGAEQLSVWSDGTIDFGLHSRPFDDDGCGTRRFPLVDGGTLAGLALDARNAGLLGREPNGGIRNLVITTATASDVELLEARRRPVLVIDSASWIRAEPGSDTLTIGIRSGRVLGTADHERVVTGGIAHGSARSLLARPLGSNDRSDQGWYRGPALLRLGDCQVLD